MKWMASSPGNGFGRLTAPARSSPAVRSRWSSFPARISLRFRWSASIIRAERSWSQAWKGLRALHERDDIAQLPAGLVPRLKRILFRLQEATHPGSADAPGFRLHPLKGDRAGQWSVRVSSNWRVVFRFKDAEAVDVDLIDYH